MKKIKCWLLLIVATPLYFLALLFEALADTVLSVADAVLRAAEKEGGL